MYKKTIKKDYNVENVNYTWNFTYYVFYYDDNSHIDDYFSYGSINVVANSIFYRNKIKIDYHYHVIFLCINHNNHKNVD